MRQTLIEISGRTIGAGQPCYILAEVGSNHNQDLATALQLIDVAAQAGCDAVKFQMYQAEGMAAKTRHPIVHQAVEWGAEDLQRLYERQTLPLEWLPRLHEHAHEVGIELLFTPYSYEAVDRIVELGVRALKIASFELVHLPLLRYAASHGLPMILSTGMAYLAEIEEAVRTVRDMGNEKIILLHCGVDYPLDPAYANLRAIQSMHEAFQLPIGYSDHTAGTFVAVLAVAMGACCLEKHITLKRQTQGASHEQGLEPEELTHLVQQIREAEWAIGDGVKRPRGPRELDFAQLARRSIFAATDMTTGTILTAEKLDILRPGVGLHPRYFEMLIGRRIRKPLLAGDPITWDDI
ncbi:MAG: N,N'-diacetyllegionaminic acid synthase [Phycisphaerae bacterium]|nr:N,N'-diacetyllegionaminic acid synthase [Phycisphaerae bacterium]